MRLRYVHWGSKVRQQAFLAPLPGTGNSNLRETYLSFWTNPNFIIAYILCFLFVSMNVGNLHIMVLKVLWIKILFIKFTNSSKHSLMLAKTGIEVHLMLEFLPLEPFLVF